MRTLPNLGFKLLVLLLAAAVWFPCIHLFFKPSPDEFRAEGGIASGARQIAQRHLNMWTDPKLQKEELDKMQLVNPEWDFMSRTYFVLSLANMALRDRSLVKQACAIIDLIIENTLRIEREEGYIHFLLGYGREEDWIMHPSRSIFVDGEIALMLAARRFVEEKLEYKPLLRERVELLVDRMNQSPVMCAESYPDECWLFCNTVALAAVRLADLLDRTDHSDFLARWVRTAKKELLCVETGILISTFAVDGSPSDSGFGAEGTSIWMALHMLQVVDKTFARAQYSLAKKELARSLFGFGYSREWPACQKGYTDVDSGPVFPMLGLSASASGLAILGAAAFDDTDYFTKLMTSLNFAGFPRLKNGALRYMASNPVGDSVLLYAMVEGPLWDEVLRRLNHADD